MEFYSLLEEQEKMTWEFGYAVDECSHSTGPTQLSQHPNQHDLPQQIQQDDSMCVDKNQEKVLSQESEALGYPNQPSNNSVEISEIVISQKESFFESSQKQEEEEEEEEESYSCHQKRKRRRKRKTIAKPLKQYPTKNFLPAFRSSFLDYLKKCFDPIFFESLSVVYKIRHKDCINLKDYQDLLNEPLFKSSLLEYFRDRVIYRDLMASRVDAETKRNYLARIHVFEKAFRLGVFKSIN